MTGKVPINAQASVDAAGQDFAALVDNWIDQNWYLPSGGDQSWREREAQRLFGRDGEKSVDENDEATSFKSENSSADEIGAPSDLDFKRGRLLNILLPISLITFVMVLSVALSAPEIFKSSYWAAGGSKAPSVSPVRVVSAAVAVVNATPRLAVGDQSTRGPEMMVTAATHRRVGPAIVPMEAHHKIGLARPRPQILITTKQNSLKDTPAVHRAKQHSPIRAQLSWKEEGCDVYAANWSSIFRKTFRRPNCQKLSDRPVASNRKSYFESHSPAAR